MSGTLAQRVARAAAARRRRLVWRGVETALLLAALLVILFPILWMALTAFKRPVDLFDLTVFFTPTIDNFRAIFAHPWNIGATLLNSAIVAFATVLIAIPASLIVLTAKTPKELILALQLTSLTGLVYGLGLAAAIAF